MDVLILMGHIALSTLKGLQPHKCKYQLITNFSTVPCVQVPKMTVMDTEVCGAANIIYSRHCLKLPVDVEMKNSCIVAVCKVSIYVCTPTPKERGKYCLTLVFLSITSYCCSFLSSDSLQVLEISAHSFFRQAI